MLSLLRNCYDVTHLSRCVPGHRHDALDALVTSRHARNDKIADI